MADKLRTLFDRLGGIAKLVRGKTVTVRLNPMGNPYGQKTSSASD